MKIIEKDSVFSAICDFTLSETDEEVLTLLYLPVIHAKAFAVYHYLLHLKSAMAFSPYLLHNSLLVDLNLTETEFLKAREALEGIGLLNTYRLEKNMQPDGIKVFYKYVICPPASPKKFFNDILLKALLSEAVGEKRYHILSSLFKRTLNNNEEGYINISSSFNDVYTLHLTDDSPAVKNQGDNFIDKEYCNQSKFDRDAFIDYLIADNISVNSMKADIDNAIHTATLYSLDSKKAYKFFVESLDSSNNFYPKHFLDLARSQHSYVKDLAEKTVQANLGQGKDSERIRYLEKTSPKEFLQNYFHAEPAKFMYTTIEKLSFDLGFNNAVITAILSYSLMKTKGEFNQSFIEKVAYSLSAQKIHDTYDVLVYLENRDFEISKKKGRTKKVNEKVEENPKEKIEFSEDEIQSLREDLGL